MSFNTALSGLNAATSDLNVKSNNIANVNTTGFKESRAEFADIFAVSTFGNSDTAIGSGVVLTNVAQQFKQGNLEFTDNALDLSVSGQGFFALAPNQTSNEIIYSRAGAFNVDKDGFIVNNSGQYLRAFPVNADGTVSSTSITSTTPMQLPSTAGIPQATSTVAIATNLPSTATALTGTIDPNDTSTFTNSTSVTIFDSLGTEHILTLYYQKTATANQWNVDVYIPGEDIVPVSNIAPVKLGTTQTLTFDPALGGALATTSTTQMTFNLTATQLASGAAAQSTVIKFDDTTQNSSAFSVVNLTQDGFPTGRLSGLDIDDDGLVRATFTNGQANPIGKITLANFNNPQGLQQIGNTSWVETLESGQVQAGEAGTGILGLIQSGALETSNVDLTAELVGLITAQRNFQANSKAIETNNAITQTIINLR